MSYHNPLIKTFLLMGYDMIYVNYTINIVIYVNYTINILIYVNYTINILIFKILI